ncbi:hypothetical protein Pmar_PMAR023285 [Perkinsus marinus ATCC 50983]|uniref:Uncharacterized protein n=1 Tax=Perkinsus marinus (strain ATCC 50983 / TXsc) TaxID=423536 RepID=C5KK49_PERM5|nr:hypothetical protein Pmar_PMAR023285 [Perkinsus marinus ATCC 50983]EER14961.1 hypothetical protein Pmar_PMAR023285 [Perkinsus marinus ATCC 50983]|eukprot:XP_002783165.1 hypothetical protein Pmar_PMAR023285 [Perkinsus marinus ATCC 50983]
MSSSPGSAVTQLNLPSFEMAKALALGSALMDGLEQEKVDHTPWLTMLDQQFMEDNPVEGGQSGEGLVPPVDGTADIPASAPEEPESFPLAVCQAKRKPAELTYVERLVPKSIRRAVKPDDVSARWTFLDNRLCVELTNKLFGDDRILYVSADVEPHPQPMGMVGPRSVDCLPLFAEADELLLRSKELRLLLAMVCRESPCHLGEIVMTLGDGSDKKTADREEKKKTTPRSRKRQRSPPRRSRADDEDDDDEWDLDSDTSEYLDEPRGASVNSRSLPKRLSRRPPKRLGIDDDTVSDYTSDLDQRSAVRGTSRAIPMKNNHSVKRSGGGSRDGRKARTFKRRSKQSEVEDSEADDSTVPDEVVMAAARARRMRASADIWPPGVRPVGTRRLLCMVRGEVVYGQR